MKTVWLGLHVVTVVAAYVFCALAGIMGIVYLVQDNNLKHKRFGALFERLPALEKIDHLMSRQIGAAFLVLTLSLVLGAHLVRLSGAGAGWVRDPKVMTVIATWGIYAVLMHLRTRADRHGKGMALVTIACLIFILFVLFGVYMVSGSLHGFSLTGQ